MLEKDQLREVLKNPRINIYYAVEKVKEYILQRDVMILVIDSIVEQVNASKGKPTTQDLYRYFYIALNKTVEGTTFCRDAYTTQQFLKNIWNDGVVQGQIIGYFRKNGYVKPYLSEEEKIKRAEKLKEKEAQKSAAKARKAKKIKKCRSCNYKNCKNRVTEFEKEFEKIQKSVPVCFVEQKVRKVAPKPQVVTTPSTPKNGTHKGKEMTAEEQAYINRLKGM